MRFDPINGLRVAFGYNAVEDKSRRKAPEKISKAEWKILTKAKRKKLQATAQDQVRNHSLVGWMVRKHLDYVSKFHLNFRTEKRDVDETVNRIFRWHGSPLNMDYGQRFGRDEMFRLFELEKVTGGDALFIKQQNLRLQAIESDMVAPPTIIPDGTPVEIQSFIRESVNSSGLVMSANGAVTDQYCICNRGENGNQIVFDHLEPSRNIIFDAYWTRLSSQYRGVSPLSTALNTVQDLYEGIEYNQLKVKMHALFGVAVFRNTNATPQFGGAAGAPKELDTDTEATAAQNELDLDPRTINLLDLDTADKLQMIESSTPSAEFVAGSYLFIQIAMLALDIPITTFDSRRSSFSARIADLNEYEVSVDSKRTKNRYVRQQYSDWVLETIWNDPNDTWGLRDVAEAAGMELRDVQEAVNWIPAGAPWLDKKKQVEGDALSISLGMDNTPDATSRRGGNAYANVDKEADFLNYAKSKGVVISRGKSTDKTAQDIVAEAMDERDEDKENDTPPDIQGVDNE
jgi:capsid protein